ncbi:unnamed protein product, partial [Dibothriocephalus latus]
MSSWFRLPAYSDNRISAKTLQFVEDVRSTQSVAASAGIEAGRYKRNISFLQYLIMKNVALKAFYFTHLRQALAPPTLASLLGNALAEQPHTVEDFFRLCSRLVQHCAPLFFTSTSFDLAALLDTSIRSLDLPTIATSSSAAADDLNVSSGSQQQQGASKAGTSATAASARFLFELLLFTAESSEDQPVA